MTGPIKFYLGNKAGIDLDNRIDGGDANGNGALDEGALTRTGKTQEVDKGDGTKATFFEYAINPDDAGYANLQGQLRGLLQGKYFSSYQDNPVGEAFLQKVVPAVLPEVLAEAQRQSELPDPINNQVFVLVIDKSTLSPTVREVSLSMTKDGIPMDRNAAMGTVGDLQQKDSSSIYRLPGEEDMPLVSDYIQAQSASADLSEANFRIVQVPGNKPFFVKFKPRIALDGANDNNETATKRDYTGFFPLGTTWRASSFISKSLFTTRMVLSNEQMVYLNDVLSAYHIQDTARTTPSGILNEGSYDGCILKTNLKDGKNTYEVSLKMNVQVVTSMTTDAEKMLKGEAVRTDHQTEAMKRFLTSLNPEDRDNFLGSLRTYKDVKEKYTRADPADLGAIAIISSIAFGGWGTHRMVQFEQGLWNKISVLTRGFLATYATNMNEKYGEQLKNGTKEPFVGREEIIETIIEKINKRSGSRSVLVLGNKGSGKSAIVEHLSALIGAGLNTDPRLNDFIFFALKPGDLSGGGELGGGLQKVKLLQRDIERIFRKTGKTVVVFMDEVHELPKVGRHSTSGEFGEVGNAMKPALMRGKTEVGGTSTLRGIVEMIPWVGKKLAIRIFPDSSAPFIVVGATTLPEYQQHIANPQGGDPALGERFGDPIVIPDAEGAFLLDILQNHAQNQERLENVRFARPTNGTSPVLELVAVVSPYSNAGMNESRRSVTFVEDLVGYAKMRARRAAAAASGAPVPPPTNPKPGFFQRFFGKKVTVPTAPSTPPIDITLQHVWDMLLGETKLPRQIQSAKDKIKGSPAEAAGRINIPADLWTQLPGEGLEDSILRRYALANEAIKYVDTTGANPLFSGIGPFDTKVYDPRVSSTPPPLPDAPDTVDTADAVEDPARVAPDEPAPRPPADAARPPEAPSRPAPSRPAPSRPVPPPPAPPAPGRSAPPPPPAPPRQPLTSAPRRVAAGDLPPARGRNPRASIGTFEDGNTVRQVEVWGDVDPMLEADATPAPEGRAVEVDFANGGLAAKRRAKLQAEIAEAREYYGDAHADDMLKNNPRYASLNEATTADATVVDLDTEMRSTAETAGGDALVTTDGTSGNGGDGIAGPERGGSGHVPTGMKMPSLGAELGRDGAIALGMESIWHLAEVADEHYNLGWDVKGKAETWRMPVDMSAIYFGGKALSAAGLMAHSPTVAGLAEGFLPMVPGGLVGGAITNYGVSSAAEWAKTSDNAAVHYLGETFSAGTFANKATTGVGGAVGGGLPMYLAARSPVWGPRLAAANPYLGTLGGAILAYPKVGEAIDATCNLIGVDSNFTGRTGVQGTVSAGVGYIANKALTQGVSAVSRYVVTNGSRLLVQAGLRAAATEGAAALVAGTAAEGAAVAGTAALATEGVAVAGGAVVAAEGGAAVVAGGAAAVTAPAWATVAVGAAAVVAVAAVGYVGYRYATTDDAELDAQLGNESKQDDMWGRFLQADGFIDGIHDAVMGNEEESPTEVPAYDQAVAAQRALIGTQASAPQLF